MICRCNGSNNQHGMLILQTSGRYNVTIKRDPAGKSATGKPSFCFFLIILMIDLMKHKYHVNTIQLPTTAKHSNKTHQQNLQENPGR